MDNKQYDTCPHCGSDDLQNDEFDWGGDVIHVPVVCQECGTTWTDVFEWKETLPPEEEE